MGKLQQAIRTGQQAARPGQGNCGPMPAATPMSWGAACPSGNCTSEDLAVSLNRSFGGERMGCREIPYNLRGATDGAGALTLSQNALITICPTRVLFSTDDLLAIPLVAVMTSFTIGSQNQILGDPIPVMVLSGASYAIIPFVTDCIKAGTPFSMTFTGLTATQFHNVTLIGPAVG